MAWFERHPRRLAHERYVLAALVQEGWVTTANWVVDEQAGTAHVDIDFMGGGKLREARLEYPFIYPSAPPRLVPRAPGQRWSNHQWGTQELCLQIRSDTWIKSLDGADMLRSARELLDTEGSVNEAGQRREVLSEHNFTDGQLLRWEYARLVVSDELLVEVRRRGKGTWILDLRTTFFEDKACVSFGVSLSGSPEHDRWTDPTVPPSIGLSRKGMARIANVQVGDVRFEALGVSSFYLVDSDFMKVGNIERNELDWAAVGAHKADALKELLKRIHALVTVDLWVNHLGGQTTSADLEMCLSALSKCDLIIETTGSGEGFVYASGVSEDAGVPIVWGRVFGGGFGGYIARSRPNIEASALDVRSAIFHWFNTPGFPAPPADAAIDYGAGPDDQAPMIADDADVSAISAHLTQFAADALRSVDQSDYPQSVYVIGFRKEWIFEQPFDIRPVDVSAVKTSDIVDAEDARAVPSHETAV